MINNVTIAGRLGRDIELRNAGDHIVVQFSLAVNDGKDKMYWIDCIAWNKTAELLQKYTGKGLRLGVTGKLIQENWTDSNGEKKSRIRVQVIGAEFIDWKESNSDNNSTIGKSPTVDDFEYNNDFSSNEDKRIPF